MAKQRLSKDNWNLAPVHLTMTLCCAVYLSNLPLCPDGPGGPVVPVLGVGPGSLGAWWRPWVNLSASEPHFPHLKVFSSEDGKCTPVIIPGADLLWLLPGGGPTDSIPSPKSGIHATGWQMHFQFNQGKQIPGPCCHHPELMLWK